MSHPASHPPEPAEPIVAYGGGGHGRTVAEAAAEQGWHVVGFVDDNRRPGDAVGPWCTIDLADVDPRVSNIIVTIGDNAIRQRVCQKLREDRWRIISVIHPTAWVSPSATIGVGVYVGPHATINAHAVLEDGALVNSHAVVEHDVCVGAFAHVAPNAAVCGHGRIGERAMVGAGATIIPEITVGPRAIIGAGAAVVRDIPADQTVVGVPAKPLD